MPKGKPREFEKPYQGMYFARWLKKDRITAKEYIRFVQLKRKIEKKIDVQRHWLSVVEKVMRKYNVVAGS